MNIVQINGSPRKDGNSTILGRAVVEGAISCGAMALPEIYIEKIKFRGCQNCGGCNDSGICIVKDDMQTAYSILREADIWVFNTPIYFDTISGQLKLFYDRLFCFSKKKLEGQRKAAFAIAYEMERNDNYVANMKVYQDYLKWFSDFTESNVVQAWGMAKHGDILKCPEFIEEAKRLGKKLAEA